MFPLLLRSLSLSSLSECRVFLLGPPSLSCCSRESGLSGALSLVVSLRQLCCVVVDVAMRARIDVVTSWSVQDRKSYSLLRGNLHLNLNFFVLLNRRLLLCSVRLSQSDSDDLVVLQQSVCVCVFGWCYFCVIFSVFVCACFLFCFFVSAFDSFSSLHFGV